MAAALTGPLFAEIDPTTAELLKRTGRPRAIAADAALFHEGDRAADLIVVVEGQVRVWRSAPSGATVTVHRLGLGDVPGCVAVFRGIPYPATASAMGPVTVVHWPAERILALLREDAALAANALEIVGHRNGEMLQRLLEVSTQSVEQRLARTLLRLAKPAARTPPMELRVSRQELAELTATTLHTVSRFISRWEAKGIVAGGRGRVLILDAPALARLSGDN